MDIEALEVSAGHRRARSAPWTYYYLSVSREMSNRLIALNSKGVLMAVDDWPINRPLRSKNPHLSILTPRSMAGRPIYRDRVPVVVEEMTMALFGLVPFKLSIAIFPMVHSIVIS